MKLSTDIHYLSIAEAGRRLEEGSLRSIDLVEACLDRIETNNKKLRAFITVLAGQARESALQADAEMKRGNRRSPLHGIPVAFKDMYDTAGVRTTAGFKHFKNRIPQRDANAVNILKEAGAVILGKTNMHELAMGTTSQVSFFGAVRNPWNLDYIPGGSSGGSAAAVAAGLCFATIDTDAIGSTRLPASCCGVSGFKCTWALMDNSGILEGEPVDPVILSLATVGITARTASDIALVGEILAPGKISSRSLGSSLRLGIVQNFHAETDINEAFGSTIKILQEAGYRTTNVDAPFAAQPDMSNIMSRRGQDVSSIFQSADILVLPTTATVVPRINALKGDPQKLSPQQTFFANYYGLPAISVPCGFDSNGLPIGIQFVGKPGEDFAIIELAATFQSVYPRDETHPRL